MKTASDNAILEIDIQSDMQYLSGALLRAKDFMRARKGRVCTDELVVLRELLVNAIVHGNGGVIERRVKASIRDIGKSDFEIAVEDEGAGFDYRSVRMEPPVDPHEISRSGYVLIKSLAREIMFNEKGNRVLVVVGLR